MNKNILDSYERFKGYFNNLSHAYLFINNGEHNFDDIVYCFAALILNNFINDENIEKIIKSIKDRTNTEVRIITPEGLWIKKEQIIELKSDFKSKALNGSKKIYIINEIDKLNNYSANSILKFLEEPEDDIVAILTTNNPNSVHNTVLSRCQKIILSNHDNNINSVNNMISDNKFINFSLEKDEIDKLIDNIIKFIKNYEENNIKVICFSKDLFYKTYNKKEEIDASFKLMILFYKDVLNYIMKKNIEYFYNYEDLIIKIASNNNQTNIIYKIKILMQKKDLIKYNINVNLLFDSLILEFEGEKI